MCETIDAIAGSLNLPTGIVYLLIGLVLGLVLGWILGRQRPASPGVELDDSPSIAHAVSDAKPAGVSLVVNGKMVEVAPTVMEEVQALIMGNQKIEAIKRLREESGLNLAAAKAVVESLDKAIH